MSQESQGIGALFMEKVKKNAGLAIALGVLIAIAGVVALSSPMLTGLSVAMMVGILLMIGGVAQLIFAFKAAEGMWPYVSGILTIVAGFFLANNVGVAAGALTFLLGAYLIASGISEIIMAFQVRPMSGWLWTLISGVLSVVLSFMIMTQFPLSGMMAVGILLGFRLVFTGISMIMIGIGARRVVKGLAS